MILLILLSVVLFVCTHIDDLVLLIAFFAHHAESTRFIVAGQYLGVTVLLLGGLLCAEIALMVPQHYLRLLGLVPLGLGLIKIPAAFRRPFSEDEARPSSSTEGRLMGSVAALTLAGGGDNLGVYLPFFATHPPRARFVILAVFLVMTGVWCAIAHSLAHHRLLLPLVRRWGLRVLPIVLIGLGLRILFPGH